MSNANSVTPITREELARLIRLLGMLGSEHDGEALNAARLAVKWLRTAGTDWQTLLEPPETTGVVSVGVGDPGEAIAQLEAAAEQAYSEGYKAGYREAIQAADTRVAAALAQAQQAQASIRAQARQQTAQAMWTSLGGQHGAGTGLGGAYTAPGASAGPGGPASSQAAPGAPGTSPGPSWPPSSWQAVAQELLDRHAAGIPGIFRGSREIQFVQDVLARGFRTLTQAQDVWLRDIAARSGISW